MTFKQLLKSQGFTQAKLSKALIKQFGYYKYQQQISEWVKGIRLPDLDAIYYVSKVLAVSCDVLVESFMEGRVCQ